MRDEIWIDEHGSVHRSRTELLPRPLHFKEVSESTGWSLEDEIVETCQLVQVETFLILLALKALACAHVLGVGGK